MTVQEFALAKGFEIMLYPDAAVMAGAPVFGHTFCPCATCNDQRVEMMTGIFGRWPSNG